MIIHRFLQVTYRNGRPFAAYLYLPRKLGDKSARSVRCESGLVIDYAADGRPIGVEITAPQSTSLGRCQPSTRHSSVAAGNTA